MSRVPIRLTSQNNPKKKQSLALLILAWVSAALVYPSFFITTFFGPIVFAALALVIAIVKLKSGAYKKNYIAILCFVIAELVLGAIAVVVILVGYALTCTGSC